ncbi:hypothetical protein WR25_22015 [Diploscapter pachys]|uniref:Apple domain-containing protein n=1 Tax=Diploscapter pachys TaxID=2018661 RepID=A0A2A2JRC6_9BILA|nr:hypothetical protein WR25_22015 [Diploscapter pachys]
MFGLLRVVILRERLVEVSDIKGYGWVCERIPGCNAFTWKIFDGICYLKESNLKGVQYPENKTGAICGRHIGGLTEKAMLNVKLFDT